MSQKLFRGVEVQSRANSKTVHSIRISLAMLMLVLVVPCFGASAVYELVYSFQTNSGKYPGSGLIEGKDGRLYGTTVWGGSHNRGTVFSLRKDGTGFATLHNFGSVALDGVFPGGLLEAGDSMLYGTTYYSLSVQSNWVEGTVFRLNKDGSGYAVLHHFTGSDGSNPYAKLIEGDDGALYSGVSHGGPTDQGVLFKLNRDGSGFSVIRTFRRFATEGYIPSGTLLKASDSKLYGTTMRGGINDSGSLFTMNSDGTEYTHVASFPTNVCHPYTALIEARNGTLYGASAEGGDRREDYGLFAINKDGTGFAQLHVFEKDDGMVPNALVQFYDGALYGKTTYGNSTSNDGIVFRIYPDGTGYEVLWRFAGTPYGALPSGDLMLGSDGAFYGVTQYTGDQNVGAVYRIRVPSGNSPPIARTRDITLFAYTNCTANGSIDDGSYDHDPGDTFTLTETPAGPFPIGVTVVTLTATDNHGASNSSAATVTVIDASMPSIIAPPDVQAASDPGNCDSMSNVALGTPVLADNCGIARVLNNHPSTIFPVGDTWVTWAVTDVNGNSNSVVQKVTIVPSITAVFASPVSAQPVSAEISPSQVVPLKVKLSTCSGGPVTTGVVVMLKVQGIDRADNSIFQEVEEQAKGIGISATAGSDGIMALSRGAARFNLDTDNFIDPNTAAHPSRCYRATVLVRDVATSFMRGQESIDFETKGK